MVTSILLTSALSGVRWTDSIHTCLIISPSGQQIVLTGCRLVLTLFVHRYIIISCRFKHALKTPSLFVIVVFPQWGCLLSADADIKVPLCMEP